MKAFLVALLIVAPAVAIAEDKPNILFIMGEDASAAHFGIYGNKAVRTPNIDSLGTNGIVFQNAFATSPQCSPTKASIVTGLMPWMLDHPIVDHRLRFNVKFRSYSEICEQAGYRTGHTSKGGWQHGYNEDPGERGKNPAGKKFESFSEFLESHPKRKPFCFWAGYGEAHRPFPEKPIDAKDFEIPPYLPDTPEIREEIGAYLKELQILDDRVGQVVNLLKAKGLYENTLIILMPGDHGWPFPRGKVNLYDSGTKIPLILHWHGKIGRGKSSLDLVSAVDIFPTVLDAVGLEIPGYCLGKSLLPLAMSEKNGITDPSRNLVYMARGWHGNYYPSRAVRDRDFLYIRNFRIDLDPAGLGGSSATFQYFANNRTNPEFKKLFNLSFGKRPQEELYDLKSDPHQMKNLAENPNFSEIKTKFAAYLVDYQTRTNDPVLKHKGNVDADKLNYIK